MNALVVDDSSTMRKILRGLLEGLGFSVGEAGNGREALEYLEVNEEPDLVLLDWHMPEVDGLEFLKRVRADGRHKSMTITMVTAQQDLESVTTALECGASEYIMKPFTEDILREKLQLLELISMDSQ